MMCKVHPLDHTSSVGVCASCLRHRLFPVLVAQAQADARAQTRHLRKSDTTPEWHHPVSNYHKIPGQKFFSTPQPQISIAGSFVDDHKLKKKKSKFSLLSNLFKFRTGKRVKGSGQVPDPEEITTTVTSSPLWFSSVLVTRKQLKTCPDDHSGIKSNMKSSNRPKDWGISPSMYYDNEEKAKHYHMEESKTSGTTGKRGGRRSNLSGNVTGIGFWLNPLVRASPNRHWSQGGVPTDVVVHL